MKRAVSVAVSALILAVVSASNAKPPSAPATPPPPQPTQKAPPAGTPGAAQAGPTKTAAAIYFKPSKDGADTAAIVANKTAATLNCMTHTQQDLNFKVEVKNGLAYCKNAWADVNKADVLCTGGTLVTDDKLPPTVKGKFGQADACLKTGAAADDLASYSEPRCGTNSTGSGFIRQVKPGADTCEKTINRYRLMSLGTNSGMMTLPTVIGVGKEVVPTQQQLELRAFKCPAGASPEVNGNGAVCKKD